MAQRELDTLYLDGEDHIISFYGAFFDRGNVMIALGVLSADALHGRGFVEGETNRTMLRCKKEARPLNSALKTRPARSCTRARTVTNHCDKALASTHEPPKQARVADLKPHPG